MPKGLYVQETPKPWTLGYYHYTLNTVHHYWFLYLFIKNLLLRDLRENELIGPIPPILGNLSYTGKLYLHGNKLTGHIPPELGNMSKLSYL